MCVFFMYFFSFSNLYLYNTVLSVLFCVNKYITSYRMLNDVVRGMFTPADEVAFTNPNTNTISGVLCISDRLL